MENKAQVIHILNDLVGVCRAAHHTFRIAAEQLQDSEFRRLFNILSQQRMQFATELQAEIHRLGGAVDDAGTPRVFGDGQLDEKSIISECQNGDQAAVKRYETAFEADLPVDVRYLTHRQYMDIKDACDRMGILRRAA